MRDATFWFSYVTLWVFVLAIGASVALLLRQEGRRLLFTPHGRSDQGPSIGPTSTMSYWCLRSGVAVATHSRRLGALQGRCVAFFSATLPARRALEHFLQCWIS